MATDTNVIVMPAIDWYRVTWAARHTHAHTHTQEAATIVMMDDTFGFYYTHFGNGNEYFSAKIADIHLLLLITLLQCGK